MARPRKAEDKKRRRVSITTLPKILTLIKKRRVFMARSEFIHRILVDWYNREKDPGDDPIRYWGPGEEKK